MELLLVINGTTKVQEKKVLERKETPVRNYTKNKYYKNSFTNTKKKQKKKKFSYYILMKFQLFI